MYICIWICAHVYVGMGQMVIQGIFPYFVRQGLSLNLEFIDLAKLVSARDFAVHLSPSAGVTHVLGHFFHVGLWDPNLGPCIC